MRDYLNVNPILDLISSSGEEPISLSIGEKRFDISNEDAKWLLGVVDKAERRRRAHNKRQKEKDEARSSGKRHKKINPDQKACWIYAFIESN